MTNKRLFFKKLCMILYVVLLPMGNCFAYGDNNRPIISYFVNNVFFNIIASGGYYSLGGAVILSIAAWRFKKFREALLSVLMAIMGIVLLVFVYQALEDFDWLPAVNWENTLKLTKSVQPLILNNSIIYI